VPPKCSWDRLALPELERGYFLLENLVSTLEDHMTKTSKYLHRSCVEISDWPTLVFIALAPNCIVLNIKELCVYENR
jgi:hypothetical protein